MESYSLITTRGHNEQYSRTVLYDSFQYYSITMCNQEKIRTYSTTHAPTNHYRTFYHFIIEKTTSNLGALAHSLLQQS